MPKNCRSIMREINPTTRPFDVAELQAERPRYPMNHGTGGVQCSTEPRVNLPQQIQRSLRRKLN
jgi:hypothetical protein